MNGIPAIHVAIVGAGPSGFYAAEALLRSGLPVRVDMIERLPTPFGLVRSGVSPDHPKLKQPILVYERIARTPGFNFFGNVQVGRDVTVTELRATHHAVVFACGAETDRRMGIPGEDLPRSHTATEFVGWFNGHPNYRDRTFDLTQETVAVVGQGNVAADVCRILAKPVDELRSTDMAEHALDALARSRVREIHVIGRRGPVQAKFTTKELRELGEIAGCSTLADAADLALNAESETELADRNNLNGPGNIALFRAFAARKPAIGQRAVRFRFHRSPEALVGDGHVEKLILTRNRLEGPPFAQVARPTDEQVELDCGLVFRSIGYRGVAIPGLPFDGTLGTVPHTRGRVLDGPDTVPGLYVTGWLKRGPTGIIGTNRADSVETVESLLADLSKGWDREKCGAEAVCELLERRGVRVFNYQDWSMVDTAEISRGKLKGKPREKFTRIDEMLAASAGPRAGDPLESPVDKTRSATARS
jgi:ferredoxin--NADP+ reductase